MRLQRRGARHNDTIIQAVGIGTITDSPATIRRHVFEDQCLSPSEVSEVLAGDFVGEEGLARLAALVRTYSRQGGHHVQFNVVNAETLRAAQANPNAYRSLIVRVAGYSDYFCDLPPALQEEIIARTEHQLE